MKTLSSLCKTQQEEIKGYRKGLEVGGEGGASGASATAPTTTAPPAPAPATTEAVLVAAAAAEAAAITDPAKTDTVAEVEVVREGGGSPTIMSTPEMELAYDDI